MLPILVTIALELRYFAYNKRVATQFSEFLVSIFKVKVTIFDIKVSKIDTWTNTGLLFDNNIFDIPTIGPALVRIVSPT